MSNQQTINYLQETKDFDVPLDWLYKGKRKNKLKQTTTNTNNHATISNKINKEKINNEEGLHSTDKELKTQFTILNKRSRSSSVSNGLLDSSILRNNLLNSTALTTKQSHSPLSPSKNTSAIKENASSPSSSSSSPPPPPVTTKTSRSSSASSNNSEGRRKSLISSLFGRNKTSPSITTPPINITTNTNTSKIDQTVDINNIETNVPLKVGSPDFNHSSPSSASSSSHHHHHHHSHVEDMLPVDSTPLSRSKLDGILNVPLKRVTFAVDKFDMDPPQQLPSRKPKLGNVLIPQDMISDIPTISQGISNTDNDLNPIADGKITKDSKEFKSALEIYNQNLKEATKHQQEAHKAAEKIAKEVKSFNGKLSRKSSLSIPKRLSNNSHATDDKIINNSNDTDTISRTISNISDDPNAFDISAINIDKPLHLHEHYFEKEQDSISSNLTLDIIYTRCCHLREILPIPSTLRQLRGKTSPLHILKFLNPRPTLIDILSFCDFIAIVPIHNVIFDNVTLNSEMLKTVLSSLVNSITLEKIGLRNVVIQQKDWPFFCKFLLNNKSIIKLDISQTKTRSDLLLKDHREYMDWDLLTNVIRLRKGKPLEELLLNGIKLMYIPLPQFQHLLINFGETYRQSLISNKSNSASSSTLSLQSVGSDNVGIRLGLASTEITDDYLTIILNWMSKYSIQGVDLSFNNLNPFLRLLAKKFARLSFDNLQYFTLNNTNVYDVTNLALLLKYLSRLPNLKFLDISNIPEVFPGIVPYLYKYLPRFPNLKRIHIDNNNLNYRQIIMLCNILVKCKNLSHVSMLYEMDHKEVTKTSDNSNSTKDDMNIGTTSTYTHKFFTRNTVWAALYSLARDSPNLFSLDIDYEQVSDEVQSRIALCLMRNMQHAVNSDFKIDALSSQDQLLFDGSLLAETADDVLKKLNTNTLINDDPHLAAAKKYMLKKYLEKLDSLLDDVQEAIDNVFEKRKIGELPSKEKENLLRLLLLEKNLKNIIEIVSSIPNIQGRSKNPFVVSNNSNNTLGSDGQLLTNGPSRPMLKHLDSERLMAEVAGGEDPEQDPAFPHSVATEGGNRIVDTNTGKPILYKSASQTSIQSRIQEKEEGELHKWGFFVQQQRSMYPQDGSPPKDPKNEYIPHLPTPNLDSGASTPLSPKFLPRIPSGEELRKAIIEAKGVATMDDLIQNVTSNKQELESIYNAAYFLTGHTKDGKDPKSTDPKSPSIETKSSK
ncbi:HMG2-induced ER-remodeling protein 1 [Monosporozyma unispora]